MTDVVRELSLPKSGWPERVRLRWRACLRALTALSIACGAGNASGDGIDSSSAKTAAAAVAGEYRHSSTSPAGKTRRSVATIVPRGAGLSVAWQEDEGNLFGGIGLRLDDVVGAAYTEALNGAFRGSGVLAYRIHGGTLEGLRLPSEPADGTLIEETLEGPATLEGRYAITHSQDASGRVYHSGYVEIARAGDTYQMTWYTPTHTYDGVGLRVGDVLIAGYAKGFAPAVVAYCIDHDLLTGIVTYGHAGTVSADFMTRANTGAGANTEPSDRCRDAISRWNSSLP